MPIESFWGKLGLNYGEEFTQQFGQAVRYAHSDVQYSAPFCACLRHSCANGAPWWPPLTSALAVSTKMCIEIATVKDVVISVAAATTAIVAVLGLNRWYSELKGKTNFDTSRSLLRAALQLREDVRRCRSPLITADEFPIEDGSGSATADTRYRGYTHAYSNRWDPVRKAAIEFETLLLEGEVLWGVEIREIGRNIQAHVNELFISIESYLEEQRAEPETRREFLESLRSTIHGKTDDEWFRKFEADLDKLEQFLGQHLGRYR